MTFILALPTTGKPKANLHNKFLFIQEKGDVFIHSHKTYINKYSLWKDLIKKLFKFLSKNKITTYASFACLFMLFDFTNPLSLGKVSKLSLHSFTCGFVACFPFLLSYIARYAPSKKNILKKTYKNFKDINLKNF